MPILDQRDIVPDREKKIIPAEHLLTHKPKLDWCETCQIAKMRDYPHVSAGGREAWAGVTTFGAHITADTITLRGKNDRGIKGQNNGICFYDMGTGWKDCIPTRDETVNSAYEAMS